MVLRLKTSLISALSLSLYFTSPISAGNVQPDLSKMEGLICYQCESNGTQMISLCDTAFFKTLSIGERFDIMFQCPVNLQDYCIRKTIISGSKLRTKRGCTGSIDGNNATVRSGCITLPEGDGTIEICLCEHDLCNKSHKAFSYYSQICIISFVINLFQVTC